MDQFLQQAAKHEVISDINSKMDNICKDESKDRTILLLQQSKIKQECDLEETDNNPCQVNYTTSQPSSKSIPLLISPCAPTLLNLVNFLRREGGST